MTESPDFSMSRVPLDEDGRLQILSELPSLWEYLLFANRLYVGRKGYELLWRDHKLGVTLQVGESVELTDIGTALSDRFSRVQAITENLEHLLSQEAQDRAFGLPGEPGDPDLIEHLALRLTQMYGSLLTWATETRALRVPEEAERLKQLAVEFAAQPIQRTHDFVDEYIASLEQAIANLVQDPSERQNISMELTFEIDDAIAAEFDSELQRLSRLL